MKALVIYRNETSLHMGTGTEIGFVDMPIQREKATGFPKGEASGIKGVFRDISSNEEYFGKETMIKREGGETEKTYEAGSLYFTDARLLFLPVRSVSDTFFVWVTCPFVLRRFIREIQGMKVSRDRADKMKELLNGIDKIRTLGDDEFVSLTNGNADLAPLLLEELKFENFSNGKDRGTHKEKLVFPEEYVNFSKEASYLNKKLKKDLFMISDAMFSYFCEMSTEVITRIKIGEDGVVKPGALFTEEFLPEYSIFYNIIGEIQQMSPRGGNPVETLLKEAGGKLQLGGGKTIGKGITVYKYILGRKE